MVKNAIPLDYDIRGCQANNDMLPIEQTLEIIKIESTL